MAVRVGALHTTPRSLDNGAMPRLQIIPVPNNNVDVRAVPVPVVPLGGLGRMQLLTEPTYNVDVRAVPVPMGSTACPEGSHEVADISSRPCMPGTPCPAVCVTDETPTAEGANRWVYATLGVVGLLAAVAAVYAMMRNRSAVPNSLTTAAAEYLPRSPEAALMIMPPAIPSYLAYKYAMDKMHPEDELDDWDDEDWDDEW